MDYSATSLTHLALIWRSAILAEADGILPDELAYLRRSLLFRDAVNKVLTAAK